VRPRSLVALALAFAAVAPRASLADTPAYSEAAKHFAAGREHVKRHRCDLAIGEFQASLAAEPSVGAYLNLADCQVTRSASAAAWRAYKLGEEIAVAKKDDRVRVAHDGATALEPKLLRVIVSAESGGAPVPLAKDAVRIDDEPVPDSAIPTGAMLEPGRAHVILVAQTGYEPAHATASGDAGETRMIKVPLAPSAAQKPEPAPAPTTATAPTTSAPTKPARPDKPIPPPGDPGRTQRTIAFVTAGVGAGALVAGAVLGFIALGQRSDLAAAVAANPSCRGTYPDGACSLSARSALDPLESKAFATATASTLLLAAGTALGAAGAVLYFTAPENGPRATVGAGPHGATFALEQNF
jgi:hypothetical protein